MPRMVTFDDSRTKLLFYDSRLLFLKGRDGGTVTHPAFLMTGRNHSVAFSGSSSSNRGKGEMQSRGRNNWNNKEKNSQTTQNSQTSSNSHGAPTGFVLCHSLDSLSKTFSFSVFAAHSSTAGNELFKGVLGTSPNTICQICHYLVHYASTCFSRY